MRTLRLVSGQRRDVSQALQWSIESLGAGGPDSSLTFQIDSCSQAAELGHQQGGCHFSRTGRRIFLPLCIWEALGVVTSMVRKPLVEFKDCRSKFKPPPL